MGIQFFGEFLIERWVITRGQLIEALELQEYRNLRFGDIAIEKGFLDKQQVEHLNEQQKTTDSRIADLAVKMGMISEEQAQEILTYHKNNHLYLGEALLELGHVTEEILERELDIFKEEQASYSLQEVSVPKGIQGRNVVEIAVDLSRKMFQRVAGMLLKVDQGVIAEDTEVKDWGDFYVVVTLPFGAPVPVRYVLSVSKEVAVDLASSILKEDAKDEPEEVIKDAVCEFCNLVCGNAVAKLAQMGVEGSIAPPAALQRIPYPNEGEKTVFFPTRLASEGLVDLRFLTPAA